MSSPESLTSISSCFFIIDPKKFFILIVIRMTNEIEPSLIRVWGKDNENSPNFVEELGEFLGLLTIAIMSLLGTYFNSYYIQSFV